MTLIGIANLADRILIQSQSESLAEQSAPEGASAALPTGKPHAPPAPPGNQHSTAHAQSLTEDGSAPAAGLFSATTFPMFTAAAHFLLGPSSNAQGNSAGHGNTQATAAAHGAPAVTNSAAAPAPPLAVISNATSCATSGATSGANSGVNSGATSAANSGATSAVSSVTVNFIPPLSIAKTAADNSELQPLNRALSAL